MLVLTRRPNEELLLGEDIRIVFLEVRGRQVKVGIEAPEDLPVDRAELRERKKRGDR